MTGLLKISNAEYQKLEAMSFSSLKQFMKTPADYRAYKDAPPEDSSDAQDLGTAVHAAILEPEVFEKNYKVVIGHRGNKEVKETIAFWVQQGATVIKPKHYESACRLRDKVRSHPLIGPLFIGGVSERSIVTTCRITGAPIKCRPDHFNQDAGVCLDLKTFDDLSDGEIDRQIRRMRYHLQAVHYLNVTSSYLQRDLRLFGNIFLQPDPPYSVRLVGISEASLDKAISDYEYISNLRRYKDCLELNEWPGYDTAPYESSVI